MPPSAGAPAVARPRVDGSETVIVKDPSGRNVKRYCPSLSVWVEKKQLLLK